MDHSSRRVPAVVRATSAGFTLIEVAVAIVILGIGLGTMISLQTRMADNVQRERHSFRATLAAQYLVSLIEIENDPPEPGDNDGDLVQALRKAGYFDGLEETGRAIEKEMQGWTVEQHVSSVDYGEFQDILRRVEMTVSWDSGERNRVSLVLFLNTPLKPQTGTTP